MSQERTRIIRTSYHDRSLATGYFGKLDGVCSIGRWCTREFESCYKTDPFRPSMTPNLKNTMEVVLCESNRFFKTSSIQDSLLEPISQGLDSETFHHLPFEFRFLMFSSSLCRIWTYESKICTGLQSRKLAEAIFSFFNVEASRKCFLQEFVVLYFTFALETIQ